VAVAALGASVCRGDLADLDGLRQAAADADGVVHLASFDAGEMRPGSAASVRPAALDALGDALAGTGKPLVAASAIGALGPLGRPSTEADPGAPGGPSASDIAVTALAGRGVRSSVVRLPPITHSALDRHGFATALIAIARKTGIAGYAGDGASRWPAVHTLDASHLYRLALENAAAGTRWHAVAEEGIAMREIAESIAGQLGLPAARIADDQLEEHFGFLSMLIGLDLPSSSQVTRHELGWDPARPGLLADLADGGYFLRS
jgi:nucleoside-diphosphate-sugar epimerase